MRLEEEINERMRIEEGLRDSEAKFRTVIEQSSEAFILVNSEGIIIEINPAFEKLSGISRGKVLGKAFWDLLYDLSCLEKQIPGVKENLKKKVLEALTIEKSTLLQSEFEGEICRSDGTVRTVLQSIFLIKTEEVNRLGAIIRDVTEQKQSEENAIKSAQNLAEVNSMAIELTELQSVDDIYIHVAEKVRSITGAVSCMVSSYNPDLSALEVEYVSAKSAIIRQVNKILPNTLKKMRMPITDQQRDQILQEFIGKRSSFKEMSFGAVSENVANLIKKQFKIGDIIGVTLQLEGQLYGTLGIYMPTNVPPPSVEMLKSIAHVVSVSLRRKRVEQELRVDEERFRTLLENATDMISVLDKDGKYKSIVNPQIFERILGYKANDLLSRNVFEILDPEDVKVARQSLDDLLAGKESHINVDLRVKCKNGKWIYLEVDAQNMLENPLVAGIVVTGRDISTRKVSDEALHQSEERFHQMFEDHHAVMLLVSPLTGMILDANKAASKFYGYSIDELCSMNINKINQLPKHNNHAKTAGNCFGKGAKFHISPSISEWRSENSGGILICY